MSHNRDFLEQRATALAAAINAEYISRSRARVVAGVMFLLGTAFGAVGGGIVVAGVILGMI